MNIPDKRKKVGNALQNSGETDGKTPTTALDGRFVQAQARLNPRRR